MVSILRLTIFALLTASACGQMTLSQLSMQRSLWPKKTTITKDIVVELRTKAGERFSNMKLKQGTSYPVVEVAYDAVVVEVIGALGRVPADSCDVLSIVDAVARKRKQEAEAAKQMEDNRKRVAELETMRKENPSAFHGEKTTLHKMLDTSLVQFQGGKLMGKPPQDLYGVQYYAFYYSAQWCPPCRRFTPVLARWYNSFKAAHPNFELVFVSSDRTAYDMENYMRSYGMKFPAVRHSSIKRSPVRKWAGNGIPCLVMVDSSGKVLAHSYVKGRYVGPDHALRTISSIVK